ncbi:MAG: SHOCT domain-containing protein [Lachnospiraceae bacterium]|nr:SHOCT domain-containing protein [Lachnospiraceae bacterium]
MAKCSMCGNKTGILGGNFLPEVNHYNVCDKCMAGFRHLVDVANAGQKDAAEEKLDRAAEGCGWPQQTKSEVRSYLETMLAAFQRRQEEEGPAAQLQNRLMGSRIEDYHPRDGRGVVYHVDGCMGRSIDIYPEKCVITVDASLGSLITGNVTDGEKTIYYRDVVGLQYKHTKTTIGYLQFETSTGLMNNRESNFFNENSFTFDHATVDNEIMDGMVAYIKQCMDAVKCVGISPEAKALKAAQAIAAFKDLLDKGAITEEEFEKKKKELL